MSTTHALLVAVPPLVAGCCAFVAAVCVQRVRLMRRYLAAIEEINDGLVESVEQMREDLLNMGTVAAHHGFGMVQRVLGDQDGFMAHLVTPDGEFNFSYDGHVDKFFQVGLDENVEVNPYSPDCDLARPIRDALIKGRSAYLLQRGRRYHQ